MTNGGKMERGGRGRRRNCARAMDGALQKWRDGSLTWILVNGEFVMLSMQYILYIFIANISAKLHFHNSHNHAVNYSNDTTILHRLPTPNKEVHCLVEPDEPEMEYWSSASPSAQGRARNI